MLVFKGEKYKREVRVITVDFSDGQSVYSDIQAEISDLDVAVLGKGEWDVPVQLSNNRPACNTKLMTFQESCTEISHLPTVSVICRCLGLCLVVNNVGMSLVAPDFFQLVPEEVSCMNSLQC